MIDNRKVKDNHQQGIERVKQRPGEGGRVGEPGKMRSNAKDGKSAWKLPDNAKRGGRNRGQ